MNDNKAGNKGKVDKLSQIYISKSMNLLKNSRYTAILMWKGNLTVMAKATLTMH